MHLRTGNYFAHFEPRVKWEGQGWKREEWAFSFSNDATKFFNLNEWVR